MVNMYFVIDTRCMRRHGKSIPFIVTITSVAECVTMTYDLKGLTAYNRVHRLEFEK